MKIWGFIQALVGVIIRLAVLVVVFSLAVSGGYVGYHQVLAAKPAAATTTYRFVAVQRGTVAATVATTGSMVPNNQAKLSFKTGGKLVELDVKVGDAVKAGTTLAKIDTTDLQFTLSQNQVNLENAQLSLAKLQAGPTPQDVTIAKTALDKSSVALQTAQSAYDKVAWRSDVGMSSQAQALQSATLDYQSALASYAKATQGTAATDLQIQQNAVKSAQIQVDQARSNLLGAVIVAPFDGTISSVTANVGELVGTSALITIVDTNSMHIEANIAETDIGKVAIGEAVNITFDSLTGVTLTGKVTAIAPSGVVQSGVVTYLVYITPTQMDNRVLGGLTSTANVVVDQRTNILYVSNRAIKIVGGQKTVAVPNADGEVVNKTVQTGLSNDTNTEITAGLAEGDLVGIATTAAAATTTTSSGGGLLSGLGGGLRVGGAAPGR